MRFSWTVVVALIVGCSPEPAPNADRALEWVGTLVAMGRPAPLASFATLIGEDEQTARRFVRALEPGVLLEETESGTTVGFRDEDFETDLRARVGEMALAVAHGRIADTLLPVANTNPYAAGAVADHLFAAGRMVDMVRLVLEGPRPQVTPPYETVVRQGIEEIKGKWFT